MRLGRLFAVLVLVVSMYPARSQQISAPEPQPGRIYGIVTDSEDAYIPGALVTLDGPAPSDHREIVSSVEGIFDFGGVPSAVPYRVKVTANGFGVWSSDTVTLSPGQSLDLTEVRLAVASVDTTVTAVFADQLAVEQVKAEEKQRVLGVIPNFYVSYDQTFVPLSAKLKFELAFRSATDVANIGAAAFLAGLNQAGNTPDYVQGLKGYGQRFGAAYADGASDILIGGAILPSLLHQDPRYFYQGTGTTRSRFLHAISAPFMAKSDAGHWEFNYSSVGGDLASGALSNLYYPRTDRGIGIVFNNALITTGGRIANALAQEFLLRKLTTHAKEHN